MREETIGQEGEPVPVACLRRHSIRWFFVETLLVYPMLCDYYEYAGGLVTINRALWFCSFSLLLLLYGRGMLSELSRVDCIILLSALYISTSLFVFCSLGCEQFNSTLFLMDIFMSVLPMVAYFIIKRAAKQQYEIVLSSIINTVAITSAIGIMLYFGLRIPIVYDVLLLGASKNASWALSSVYGPILMGYLAQLAFALTLFGVHKSRFRSVLMVLFGFTAILSTQRSAVLGLIIALAVFLWRNTTNLKENGIRRARRSLQVIMGLVLMMLMLLLADLYNVFGYSMINRIDHLIISDMTLASALKDRSEQQVITNTSNPISILIGEGFGKYSANNNTALLVQPDASFFRAFNELGIIGCMIYFSVFLHFLWRGIRKRNAFVIYCLVHTLIAFYFNRIVWSVTGGFTVFSLLALIELGVRRNPGIRRGIGTW